MNPNDPNVVLLDVVAERLGDALRDEWVFVGGSIAGLLITDPAMPAIRATDDVDLICRALLRIDYHRVEVALRARGFVQDMPADAPICRWRAGKGGGRGSGRCDAHAGGHSRLRQSLVSAGIGNR